jgi:hypothetical protein
MVIEDIVPQNIPAFWESLDELDGLELTASSLEQLQECCRILEEEQELEKYASTTPKQELPTTISGVFQLTWKGAQGRLSHELHFH